MTRVAVVFTGGTISMKFDAQAGGAVPTLSGEEILALSPGLEKIAEIEVINFCRLPGPHMTPAKMMELATLLGRLCSSDVLSGVVVTHGTDTLEETAYLTDLLLQSSKPVVFVGAMRNSTEPGWDGPANLRSAVRVAAAPEARDLGVLVVMNDTILSASDVLKGHTEAVDTFRSRDFGPLGLVDKDRIIVQRRLLQRSHIATSRIEEHVEIVTLPAGSNGRLIQCAVEEGARGLILEGLGRGNVPVTAVPEVKRAMQRGIPVVITSRCAHGRVLDTYAYEGGGHHLKQMGAILGGMLPAMKARLKLMLLLGKEAPLEEIRKSFEG